MARRTSVEADRDLDFGAIDVVGGGESLFTEYDRESILGAVKERVIWGIVGIQLTLLGCFFVFVGEELIEMVTLLELMILLCFFFVPLRLR